MPSNAISLKHFLVVLEPPFYALDFLWLISEVF